MNEEKNDDVINAKKNRDDGVYEDFPKEIVHLLMKAHPIKMDEHEDVSTTMSSHDEVRAARKHRSKEAKKENTHAEKEAKAKRHEMVENQTIHTQETEKPDFNQTMAVIFDDDDDMVQLVRHKNRKKGNAKGFSTKATAQFEEIEKTVKVEKPSRPSSKKENFLNEAQQTDGTESSEMPKRKKIFEDDEHKDENDKDSKSILDNFFAYNDGYEDDYDEKKIKAKNIIMIGGIVAILVFAVLFVKTISLTGKLNKAENQIEEFQKIQSKNEELKLNVLTLEEEVVKLKSDEVEEETVPADIVSENATAKTPTGEFDTYTIKDGDSYWIIAANVYGDATLYQKILDFNNLTEDDKIKPGQVLKIPKQ